MLYKSKLDSILDGSLVSYSNPRVSVIGQYTFSLLPELIEVQFSNATKIGMYAFYNDKKLEAVDLPKLATIEGHAFRNCYSLKSISFPSVTKIVGQYAFWGCVGLTSVDFSVLSAVEHRDIFAGCKSLTKLIIRTPTVCELKDSKLLADSRHCHIYVPDNLVEQYKSATNWSVYASVIHGLSELPPE